LTDSNTLALRFFTTYTFGLLPFLANLLVNVIAATITYYSVFHIADLMYFTLTICGATVFDLVVDVRHPRPKFVLVYIWAFIMLAIIAALLLGLSSHYVAEPPASGPYEAQMHRLVTLGLALAASAFVFGLAAEAGLCRQTAAVLVSERLERNGAS
jgi:hypothetical protein